MKAIGSFQHEYDLQCVFGLDLQCNSGNHFGFTVYIWQPYICRFTVHLWQPYICAPLGTILDDPKMGEYT